MDSGAGGRGVCASGRAGTVKGGGVMADNLTELERLYAADLGLYGMVTEETAMKWLESIFKDNTLLHADGSRLFILNKVDKAEKQKNSNKLGQLLELARGIEDDYWERFYYEACHDRFAYDAAISLGSKWLFEAAYIPLPMRMFYAGVLTGKIDKPSKQGPKEGATTYRDYVICMALEELKIMGIPPTKSPGHSGRSVSGGDKKCGCQLVALALKKQGFTRLGQHSIEKIWKSREAIRALVENKEN